MKRTFVLLTFLTAWALLTHAQSVTSYSCDFENAQEVQNWTLNVGTKGTSSINKWMVGTATSFGLNSTSSMYVSPDSSTYTYDGQYGGFIVAYRQMTLAQGNYTLMYDWKLQGQSADGIYVGWVDASVNTNSNWSRTSVGVPSWLPTHAVKKNNSSFWQSASATFTASGNPGKLVVVFYYSKGTPQEPGPAIDNIEIFQGATCNAPSAITYNGNTVSLNWSGNASSYDVIVFNDHTGSSTEYTGVTGNSKQLTTLTEEGMYHFYVRAVCDSTHSTWAFGSKFMWIKGARCIDLFDIGGTTAHAGVCYHGDYADFHTGGRGQMGMVDNGYQAVNTLHTIHYVQGEIDPNTTVAGGLRTIPPGEIASVRLGAYDGSGESARIEYKYTVKAGASDLLVLQYALVMYSGGHSEQEQPRFQLEILDGRGQPLSSSCTQKDFYCGFGETSRWHQEGDIYWCDWQKVRVSLVDYIGQTLTIRLTSTRCTYDTHFCKAYFTMDCESGQFQGIACGDYSTDMFVAPEGFCYEWYKSTNPSVVVGTSDTLHISNRDTTTYLLKLKDCNDPSCFYTLVANPNPRGPKAVAIVQPKSQNCQNSVCLTSKSFVAFTNRQTGKTSRDTTAYITSVEWDLGDGSPHVFDQDTLCHVYPQAGGIYHAKLIVGMSGEVCTDTMAIDLNFPNVIASDVPIDTLNLCDTIYTDYNGHKRFMPETGGPIIDTLPVSVNQYGCEAPAYKHVWLHNSYDTTYVKRMCDGGSVIWEADGKEYKNTRPVTSKTDTFYFDLPKYSKYGCDSVMHLNLIVDPSLKVKFGNDTIYACPDDGLFEIPYELLSGIVDQVNVYFDGKTETAGFEPKTFDVGENLVVKFPKALVRPDTYDLLVDFSNELCPANPIRIPFKTQYTKAVVAQKEGFMALLNEDYNGGNYKYSSIMWLRNGELVEGGNESYIPVPAEDKNNPEVVYQVRLIREGETRPYFTCPIIYRGYTELDEAETMDANVQKVFRDGQIYIIIGEQWYDLLGRKVESMKIE